MKLIKNILARIFAFWALLLFAITLLVIMIIPTIVLGLVKEPKRTVYFINFSRVWMGIYLPLVAVWLKIYGKEHFKKNQNYVVVCNHNSFMDVPVTSPGIPGGNKTIAKIELAKIPVFGLIYRRGSVLVDRKSEESRLKSYAYMKKVLDWGLHMCIYPEGTRNKTDLPLKEFKDGAFRLAIDCGKPIIPAVLFNTRKILPPKKTFYFWPGKVEMHFLPAVETAHLKSEDAKALKEKVFILMWNFIEEKRKIK